MTDHILIPETKGKENYGHILPSGAQIADEGIQPVFRLEPLNPDYKVVTAKTWPLKEATPTAACTLNYSMSVSEITPDFACHPTYTPTFTLEKFGFKMPDPVSAPVATVQSYEGDDYEIPFGTYSFKMAYRTPEGMSLLSPASNTIVIDSKDQYVEIVCGGLDPLYQARWECTSVFFVSFNGGPFLCEKAEGHLYDGYVYEYYWPRPGQYETPKSNTTGSYWGWATLHAQSYALPPNVTNDLSTLFDWGTLNVGGYKLTVDYAAWRIDYPYFHFKADAAQDVHEFSVEAGVSTVSFSWTCNYDIYWGWRMCTEWAWNNLQVWEKIKDPAALAAAQASWDDVFVGKPSIPDSYKWEIIYQTGDVFQSNDPFRGFTGSFGNDRVGRPCIEEGAGEWHSLGIKTAYRPTAVGQYGYELLGVYTFEEMQPIADLLDNKKNHGGTGIPWIRLTSGDGSWVRYGWFQAWFDWAPAQRWGYTMHTENLADYTHTPVNYPNFPAIPDPNQWSLP
jgi:hypothetical protein